MKRFGCLVVGRGTMTFACILMLSAASACGRKDDKESDGAVVRVDGSSTVFLGHARTLVADAGYTALPERADQLAKKRYQQRRMGTAFTGGSKIGVTIEQLYTAESR